MFGPVAQVVVQRDQFLDRLLHKRSNGQKVQLCGGPPGAASRKIRTNKIGLGENEEDRGAEIISIPVSGSRIYDLIKQDRSTMEFLAQSYKTEMERRAVLWGNFMQERVAQWFKEVFGTEELLDAQMYTYAPDPTITSQPDYIVKLGQSWYFVEIKCPYKQSLPPAELLTLPNKVYCQVQSHLNCYASHRYTIEIKGCLVIYWSLLGSIIYLVQRDETFWNQCMLPAVQESKKQMQKLLMKKIFQKPTGSVNATRDETESLTSQISTSNNSSSSSSSEDLEDLGLETTRSNVPSRTIAVTSGTCSSDDTHSQDTLVQLLLDQRITAYQTRDRVQKLYVFVFHTREVPSRKVAGKIQPAQRADRYYQQFDVLTDLAKERINESVALRANLLY